MSDEKELKNKEMIASMRAAQVNMKHALDRIATLERDLHTAAQNMATLGSYLSDTLYVYCGGGNKQISAREQARTFAAEARKNL